MDAGFVQYFNSSLARQGRGPKRFREPKNIHRCFKRGEAINLCKEALASGPLNPRQLALRVMAAKGLDTGDEVLAKAVAGRLIHALRQQCRRGLIDGTEKLLGARVWALPAEP